jgi:mono/diheme cytochrome c family protein
VFFGASVLAVVLIVSGVASARNQGTPKLSKAAVAGKVLFKVEGCAKCHTLAAARSTGTVGPNLNTLHLSLARIRTQIVQGGGFMPSFGGKLSKTKINEIAAFVYAAMH